MVAGTARDAAELVTLGRRLADRVLAVVGAGAPDGAADGAARAGAAEVVAVDAQDGLLAPALVAAVWDRVVAGGVGRVQGPDLILFPMTYDGRDAGARLSARWDRPVVTNAQDMDLVGDAIEVVTTAPGRGVHVRCRFEGPPPWIVGVRPRAVEAVEVVDVAEAVKVVVEAGETVGEGEAVEAGEAGEAGEAVGEAGVRVVTRHVVTPEGVALDDAPVVVSGGQGLGSEASFALLGELAGLLGGAVGATRAAIDAGWAPATAKVGLTGHSVAPELYLAFGISGASQHLAGMLASKHVVAVNTDRHAPMLGVAELGVVADATDVLSRLLALLRARREAASRK